MATYPEALPDLTSGVPDDATAVTEPLGSTGFPHDDHHRDLGQEVEAIATELGTSPSGAQADVAARFAAVESVADAAQTAAEVAAAVAAHEADTSVHGIADTTVLATDAEVAAAVSAHEGAADPHAGYQKESEKGQAGGYASLDGSGLVPDGQIPSGIARDSEVSGLITAAIDALLDGAPGALDTLNELAAAIGDDASFAATVTTALAGKQPYSAVLAATTAAFTTADETKLDGIEAGATADQSAAELLTAIKTVDGAASGLDADLLDGNEAAAFATSGHDHDADYPVPLFDYYADVSTANTSGPPETLFTDTLAAGQLAANGAKLQIQYAVKWVGNATATRNVGVRMFGSVFATTSALQDDSDSAVNFNISVIRVSSSVVRWRSEANIFLANAGLYYTLAGSGEITGLDLSATQTLNLIAAVGGSGGSAGDITAKSGSVVYWPAA